MPDSAIDVGAVLLLVLPGFLAYRSASARRADPASRSPLWQLAEILEYSVYVHILGVGLVFGILYLLGLFGITSHLSELPGMGPGEFLGLYFVEGTLLFTLYPLYVVFAALLMGAYDLPTQVNGLIVKSASVVTRAISAVPFLGWIHPPQAPYSDEPIWYYAFHATTDGYRKGMPLLLVKMKLGDIYVGELASYPVLPDNEKNKDFLLHTARFYRGGDPSQEYRLTEQDGGRRSFAKHCRRG